MDKMQAINRLKSFSVQLDDIETQIAIGKSEYERIGKELAERFEITNVKGAAAKVNELTDTQQELIGARDKVTAQIIIKLKRYERETSDNGKFG